MKTYILGDTVDVLAVFEAGADHPKPLRFKLFENGIKKAVDVSQIVDINHIGAGGMSRIEYTCRSASTRGMIEYRLLYFYNRCQWELVR